jgi:multiple sugar transport system substrate-binding protein
MSGTTQVNAISAQPKSGTLQMLFWGSATRDKLTKATLDLYHKANPGFTITSQYYGFTDYFTKLNALITSDQAPDLIQMDMRYVAQYVRKRQLLDLTELIYNQTIDLSDYDPQLLNSSKVNNTVYGIPLGGNYQGTFYDVTQIDKAGIGAPPADLTWDTYATYANELTQALGGKVYGSMDASGDITTFELWIRQRGKDVYDRDGKINFSQTDAGDWFNYWATMRKAGGCPPLSVQKGLDVTGAPDNSTIVQGKTVFITTLSNLFDAYQTASKHQLSMIMPPTGKTPGMYLKASMLLSIYSGTKYPLTSANYANFILNNADAIKALSIERGIPGSAEAQTLLTPLLSSTDQAIIAYMNTVQRSSNARTKDVLDPPAAGDVSTLLRNTSYAISGGTASVSEGAQMFYAQATKLTSP